jgi:hypothetical protein
MRGEQHFVPEVHLWCQGAAPGSQCKLIFPGIISIYGYCKKD